MSAPTPLRVRLPFRSEDEFVAHYGAHVGRDGFFLATKAPKPLGAQLLFDLILADGRSLLRGEGVVVRSNATGERPGMTLRFVRLEAAGKALVERIVSGRPARGSAPTEAAAHPSAWAAPAGPSAAPVSPPRDAMSRPAHREAWAPPAGPARSQPSGTGPGTAVVSPPAPAEPDEVSPDEVSEASAPEPGGEAAASEAPGSLPPAEASSTVPAAVSGTPAPSEGVLSPPVREPARAAAPSATSSPEAPQALEDTSLPARSSAQVSEEPGAPAGATAGAETSPEAPEASPTGPLTAAGPELPAEEAESRGPTSAPVGPAHPSTSAAPARVPAEGARASAEPAPLASEPPPAAGTSASSSEPGSRSAGSTEPGSPPQARTEAVSETAPELLARPESGALEAGSPAGEPPAAEASREEPAGEPPGQPGTGTTGPHPPLDDSALPELVVTEFKGPGPLRPAGLEHTRASADVHAAITPPAGTLIVTELDEPPPEPTPRFQLDAPVRGDEPLHVPESSFHDVAQALGEPTSVHERPTTPIPLLPSMETAAPDEVPIPPPPPPLDEAPVPDEGAVPIEPTTDLPRTAAPEPAPIPLSLVPPAETPEPTLDARGATPASTPAPSGTLSPAASRTTPGGTAEIGIEINPDSVRVSWFHDGRAEPLLLDAVHGRPDMAVRLVREPGAPPRMLSADAPEVALWVGAPLPFLGLRAESDASRTVARRWPAAVVPDDRGEAAFALEGGTVSATELVAALLRWVRHRVEELTSQPPGRVVLTVPVAFNTVQRERLREAAERAGLEGVRLVQAPTAATMAFAHGRGLARRRILVFRMGASTCDIAVLAASGDDLDMVACGGDASLGSVNFDEQIALTLDKGARADAGVLRKRIAEAAQLRTHLEEPSLAEATIDGARLTRVELEARTTALVERGVLLAREVLRSASLAPESLDELLLVGPATRLPHLQRMIEQAMGRAARTDVDASAAVSTGAAALAHLLVAAGPKSASRTALHEVLGVPVEILAPELGQVRVLDRNTRLPAEKTLTLTLGIGVPLEVQVFQGTARAPDPRSFLGLLRAPADRAGDWTLHLSLDTDGVLRAAATNPSGKRQPLQLQMPAASPEAEAPPPPRVPSEPETPAAPPKQETGVLGGLKRLFGRR